MSRPRLFADDQVRSWRAEYRERQRVLRETRSLRQLARDAGVTMNAMQQILAEVSYKRIG